MQLARFIRKGPMPTARESLAMRQSSWKGLSLGKWSSFSWLKKYFIT